MKTIGVLTSGGDAPGMNAAIRAVVRSACESGMRVMGIRRGYKGLVEGDMYEMNLRTVSDIIHRGGTMLYSARCPEFADPEVQDKAVEVCKEFGLDGIVTIGGDGTFKGARALTLKGIPCIGIPGTIDNDIASCDHTIGYDTALNTVMDMVDRIRDTTESHDRCSIVEVMGRNAGYLALNAGIAVGATCILIPEVDYDKCTFCGACVKTCPRGLFEIRTKGDNGQMVYVACRNTQKGALARKSCKTACIACQKCAKVNPNVKIENNLSYIPDCVSASEFGEQLQAACPTKAIHYYQGKENQNEQA